MLRGKPSETIDANFVPVKYYKSDNYYYRDDEQFYEHGIDLCFLFFDFR